MKKILLGITGSVAAFKAPPLIRAWRALGLSVRVVMTESAEAFVTPLTLQALSGHPVRNALLDTDSEHAMGHIEFARWADCLVIAPATANCLAKLAHGLADDLLTTLALVFDGPIFICPSMNHSMWHHPATVENVQCLKRRGVHFIGPNEGEQACGEHGFGRMVEVEDIVTAVAEQMSSEVRLKNSVIITAGPTREALDPVRYLSNYSSGKMGYALAKAALSAGASVTLISGPTSLEPPLGVSFVAVESAEAMHEAVMNALDAHPQSIFIASAAVSDYRPISFSSKKLKKTGQSSLTLELALNPDIVAAVAESQKAAFVVGFAAETDEVLHYAKDKLSRKKLDMIVANRVGPGLGFAVDENEVTVLTSVSEMHLTRSSKDKIAANLIAIIASSLQNARFNLAESEQGNVIHNTN